MFTVRTVAQPKRNIDLLECLKLFQTHGYEQDPHLMHAYEGLIQVLYCRTTAAVDQSNVEVKATVACLCLLYLSYSLHYRNV